MSTQQNFSWSDKLTSIYHHLLPKQLLTQFAGFVATIKIPVIKNAIIRRFIRKYGVNMQEALHESPEFYANFNEFFIRQLKPACRPISSDAIISPVDGTISEIGRIHQGTLIQAKGHYYTTQELLGGDEALSSQFNNGCFTTLYLAPKDYHRIHMPIDGVLKEAIYMPGKLFSVQPSTVRTIPHLFARNERLVTLFDTNVGLMAMVLVGATLVGSISTNWHGTINRINQPMNLTTSLETMRRKGEEMGYFQLGSTVILLFANSEQVQWLSNLQAGDPLCLGQALSSG